MLVQEPCDVLKVAFGGSILGSRLGNAMIAEGTVPVPPNRPCAERDSDVLPVRGLSHFRGSHSGGGETPLSVQLGIEHFSRTTVSVYLSSALMTRLPRDSNIIFMNIYMSDYIHHHSSWRYP